MLRKNGKDQVSDMNSEADFNRSDDLEDVRSRLLSAAKTMAWEHGIESIRMRNVTRLADANSAAINYYFGSKDGLVQVVFEELMKPYVAARLRCLEEYEKGRSEIEIEGVIEALVRPMVMYSRAEKGARPLIRILLQVRGNPSTMTSPVFSETVDPVALRFVDAIGRALPKLDRSKIFWRYNFMIGSIMQILTDSDSSSARLNRLSGGLCDTSDDELIVSELVRFLAGGFKIPG